ncbi:hypothetical protein ACFTRD_28425 [Paenibacillus sp. NPDC056933]|uniref:hypothetical protein n=1 Tax=Paenibacillus sp. NPDC056933 TaxID=3345968 RepID=UPI0036315795
MTDALGNKSDVTDIAEWSSSSKTIVDVNGRFIQALSAGKTSVTPKYGEKTVTITVEVGAVQKLEADAAILAMQSGETHAVQLTATLPDGRTKDVTSQAEWTSGSLKIASVSQCKNNGHRRRKNESNRQVSGENGQYQCRSRSIEVSGCLEKRQTCNPANDKKRPYDPTGSNRDLHG